MNPVNLGKQAVKLPEECKQRGGRWARSTMHRLRNFLWLRDTLHRSKPHRSKSELKGEVRDGVAEGLDGSGHL